MNDEPDQLTKLLQIIVGQWIGSGTACFPTTASFSYREELVFQQHETHPILQYQQRTWKQMPDGSVQPSHWETGFWRFPSVAEIEVFNAQSGGRVEVGHGNWSITDAGILLRLDSVLVANDPRVQQTRRVFTFQENQVRYDMQMATTAVPQLTAHLQAELKRSDG